MRRVALFVDGDNISGQFAKGLLARAGQFGRVDIARVYIGANIPGEWAASEGYRMIVAGPGKNGSDILLALDAFELFVDTGYDVAVIVSSDQDFRHLAFRLRERGVAVVGVGEEKAVAGFRASCSDFQIIATPCGLQAKAGKCGLTPASAPTSFDINIRDIIRQNTEGNRGMPIKLLSTEMRHKHDVRISALPDKKWRTYLASRPALYDLDPKGPDAFVRYRAAAFQRA